MLVLTVLATGCASAPKTQADRLREMLEVLAESHQRDSAFLVRLNPVPCGCPEWEVHLEGRWHRAFLEPSGDPVEAIRKELQDPDGRALPRTIRVLGKLSTGVRMSDNRTQCLVLKVFGPCQDEECEPVP
ncbi:MAG TPA: hypothetical protein PLQ97_12270 [Myxococcota bacterium]|nr:hypothetical protein [Myxococcota bacterium]HQK51868.1 hypothetical protein [Myxococcota bacterium]